MRTKADADVLLARSVPNADIRAFVLMNLQRTADGRLGWRLNLKAIRSSLEQLARWEPDRRWIGESTKYRGNTLFVRGGRSKYLRTQYLAEIERRFERYTVTTLRNAAHWVHADEPDGLRVVLSNFLLAPDRGECENWNSPPPRS